MTVSSASCTAAAPSRTTTVVSAPAATRTCTVTGAKPTALAVRRTLPVGTLAMWNRPSGSAWVFTMRPSIVTRADGMAESDTTERTTPLMVPVSWAPAGWTSAGRNNTAAAHRARRRTRCDMGCLSCESVQVVTGLAAACDERRSPDPGVRTEREERSREGVDQRDGAKVR